jgi:uncharacterized protein
MVGMNAVRRLACLLLVMMAGMATATAENVAKMPKPTAYVDDYAGVMTADGKAQVEGICKEVHDKTKAQIFFVTIKSLDGNTVESFANDLFHNWGIGEKKTDRGVLLLLAVKEHKRRIEVGYGLEAILPDARVGDIGDDMVPALKTSDYDHAALAGVKEVAAVIAADSKVTLDTVGEEPAHVDDVTAAQMAASEEMANKYENAPPSAFDRAGHWIGMLFPLLFFGFFVFVFLLAFVFRRRPVRRLDGSVGFADYTPSGGGFSRSDSSSSFSSDSSSSDSFSGGDGGDSGGGGASGDW